MDEKLICLERLKKRHELRFWIKGQNMSFAEARLFLEVTKASLTRLVKLGVVPFHKLKRKARYFNKMELNLWLVQICFHPKSEIESQTAERFIKSKRVRL